MIGVVGIRSHFDLDCSAELGSSDVKALDWRVQQIASSSVKLNTLSDPTGTAYQHARAKRKLLQRHCSPRSAGQSARTHLSPVILSALFTDDRGALSPELIVPPSTARRSLKQATFSLDFSTTAI